MITFSEFAECIPQGFKMMVSAILILVLAWTLGGFCSTKLEAGAFVSSMLSRQYDCNLTFPGYIISGWKRTCFCNRYFLGNVWHFNSDRYRYVPGNRSDARCLYCRFPCRFCLRRSHVTDLRHNDHGLRRCTMPPCRACIHTASLRSDRVGGCCVAAYLVAGFTKNVFLTMAAGVILLFAVLSFIRYRQGHK